MSDLSGHTALLTGATGGIGRAVHLALQQAGAEVMAPSSHDLNVLRFRHTWLLENSIDIFIACHAAPLSADWKEIFAVDLVGTYDLAILAAQSTFSIRHRIE